MALMSEDIALQMPMWVQQMDVDLNKKAVPTLTQLQYLYSFFNGLHSSGALDASVGSDYVFVAVASWFTTHGYGDLGALFNSQEGEGDFDSWPITYHAPA